MASSPSRKTSISDEEIAAKAFQLMKELVNITAEKWVPPSRFTALADRWELTDVGARITFLTGVKALMRDIPVKVFPDLDVRQSILDAAQQALDIAIELEDEE